MPPQALIAPPSVQLFAGAHKQWSCYSWNADWECLTGDAALQLHITEVMMVGRVSQEAAVAV